MSITQKTKPIARTERQTGFHIAVCDDEPSDLREIAALARKILKEEKEPNRFSLYHGGGELLSAVRDGAKYHLFLLDVMMDDMDGMELARRLRDMGDDTAIIFISSNREMALKGYEVAAVRYLEKPVRPEQLQEALLFCRKKIYEKKGILVPASRGQRRIPLSGILYGEALEREVSLHLINGQETLAMKFSDFTALLPHGQFALCHRSYVVNLASVAYIRSRELELATGDILPVSKYRRKQVEEAFLDYLSG